PSESSGCAVPENTIRCFFVMISTVSSSGSALPRALGTTHRAIHAPPLLPYVGCLGRLLAVPEAFDVALLRALDPERARRDVLRDGRARPRHGSVPDLHGGHQHGVRTDPHVVADHRGVLVPSIVVNGDGAGP